MSHRISIDLFKSEYDEIRSVLARNGRDDLLRVLRKRRDDDYKPKTKEYHEYYDDYSTDEDAVSETYTSEDVVVDSEGHWSLRER